MRSLDPGHDSLRDSHEGRHGIRDLPGMRHGHGPGSCQVGWYASGQPVRLNKSYWNDIMDIDKSRKKNAHLEIPATEHTLIQHQSLGHQTGFRKLHIGIPNPNAISISQVSPSLPHTEITYPFG